MKFELTDVDLPSNTPAAMEEVENQVVPDNLVDLEYITFVAVDE